ncbi:DUF5105 domain-containing protein [Terrilactibacillus sp. S3-3]|nr:DUF5105 domain-containing protein [Terrilactibacillus sp. S3-3]
MIVISLAILMAGCQKKGSSSSSDAELKVISGTYVVPKDSSDEAKKYLALKIKITNKTSDSQYVSANSLKLLDSKKNSIEATDAPDFGEADNGLDDITMKKVLPNTSTSGYVVFPVKNSKQYNLVYNLRADDDQKDTSVQVPVNLKKYKDHTEDSTNALRAYVNTVFLNEKSIFYDKYVANKATAEKASFKSIASENLQHAIADNKPIKDSYLDKLVSQLQAANSSRSKISYKISSFTPEDAYIDVTATMIDTSDLNSQISESVDQVSEETNYEQDYDVVETAVIGKVIDKFPNILSKLPTKKSDAYTTVHLHKINGKWKIDTDESNDYSV